MFLHLGGDVVVPKEQVIAIINMQPTKKAEINKEFLQLAEDEGFIVSITEKSTTKSFIVTSERVFLSPISSTTLKKRSDDILEKAKEQVLGEPW